MADLSPPRSPTDRRDRAQIILVTGFALAVAFVALALVLNSVIFTENLATRSDASKASEAVNIRLDMAEGTAVIIEYVNRNNATKTSGSYGTLRRNLTESIENMSELTRAHQAASGQAVNVSFRNLKEGTRINQTDTERNVTSAEHPTDQARNWTVADDAQNIRDVRFNITDTSTLDTRDARPFNFSLEDASGNEWNLTIYETGAGNLGVDVTDGNNEVRTCTTPMDEVFINVSERTLAGEGCRALDLRRNVSHIDTNDLDTVQFVNGDHLNATYQMVVNQSFTSIAPVGTVPYGTTSESPRRNPVIYGATIHVAYEESELAYGTSVYTVPGDRDD
jgi:hypothetical protein